MNGMTKAITALALMAGIGGIGLAAPTALLAHDPQLGGQHWMGHGWGPGHGRPGYGYGYRDRERDRDGCYGRGMMGRGDGMMGPGQGEGRGYGMMDRDDEPRGPGSGGGRGDGMMGPGSGGGRGDGMMGPGMMGPGMMGSGMMGFGWGGRMMQPLEKDLTADDVRNMMERRLNWMDNPNIKVGAVEQKADGSISAEIVTQDGSLVQKFDIEPHYGWVKPERQ